MPKLKQLGQNMATKKTTSRTRAGAAKKSTARKTTARKTTASTRTTKSVQIPEVMPAAPVSRLTLGTTNKVEEDTAVTSTDTVDAPVVEETTVTEDDATPEFRRPELIEKVIERSGMKRKDVKPVVEAMLAVMGDLLVEEQDMNIAPLGKIMVKNAKELEKAHVLTVKIRRAKQIAETQTED